MPHHALAVHGEPNAALGARLAALRAELELPAEFPAAVLAEAEAAAASAAPGAGDAVATPDFGLAAAATVISPAHVTAAAA